MKGFKTSDEAREAQVKAKKSRRENREAHTEEQHDIKTMMMKVMDLTGQILKNSEETRRMLEVMANIDKRIHPTSEEIFK